MKLKLIIAAVSAGAVACAMATSVMAATWTAYSFVPADLANAQGLERIRSEVVKDTQGKLNLRIRLGGSLPIQAGNITQAVGNGTIQFGDDGFYQGNIRIAGMLQLPLLIRTQAEHKKVFDIIEPYIEKAYAEKGVIVLGHYQFPPQVAFSRKRLASLADFAGQKLRAASPQQAEFIKLVGGIPISMGAADVPSALQTNTIDGVFTASSGGGKIWSDMLKYNYRLAINNFDAFLIVNKQAFEGLSTSEQKALRDAVSRETPAITAQFFKEEDQETQALKKKGMVIDEPSAADIEQATKLVSGYWDQWAKSQGGDAPKVLAQIRKELGR